MASTSIRAGSVEIVYSPRAWSTLLLEHDVVDRDDALLGGLAIVAERNQLDGGQVLENLLRVHLHRRRIWLRESLQRGLVRVHAGLHFEGQLRVAVRHVRAVAIADDLDAQGIDPGR